MTEKEDSLFKISKVEGKITVDKRKTISPHNAVKSLKYAKLPAKCNDCIYRSVEAGGNGKCPKYELDAACGVRKDIKKFLTQLDSRNAEDLKAMLDFLIHEVMENVMISFGQSRMDGNIPDRNSRSEVNNLLNIVKVMSELNDKIEGSAGTMKSRAGDVNDLFRRMKSDKSE